MNILDEFLKPKKKGGELLLQEFQSINVGRTHVTSGCMHENEVSSPRPPTFLLIPSFRHRTPIKPLKFQAFGPNNHFLKFHEMDFFQSQARKHQPKFSKKRLTKDQVRLLETSFDLNNKLDSDRKLQLAQELGIPPRQVAIWYQNKRARWKNQSLELEYNALQLRLDAALGDKRKLEKEVDRLKQELQKAQEVLLSCNVTYSTLTSLSTSCDEDGSSSLLGDSKLGLDKELYACLIGGGDQFPKSDDSHGLFTWSYLQAQ